MFRLQQDGSSSEMIRETAAIDYDHSGMSTVTSSRNTLTLARLAGGKAKIRYTAGQDIQFIAALPSSVDVRGLELLSFQTQGQMRVSYLGRFGGESTGNWNTNSFRGWQLKDGRWLLEPASQLRPGEYCFSPKHNNDNYCFGVDKK